MSRGLGSARDATMRLALQRGCSAIVLGALVARYDRIHDIDIMESSRQPTRRLRTIGVNAGVMVLAVAAFLSGCYYRGRSPEYGRRGHYDDHRHDRHY
jgi:hypothetical protein